MTNILFPKTKVPDAKIVSQENIHKTLEKSKQIVSDNFENNSVGKIIGDDKEESKRTALMMVPPLMLIDGMIDKQIGSGNLLKKISKFGDRVSHKLKLDHILSNNLGSRINNFLSTNRFFKYFTNDYKAISKSHLAKGAKMAETYSTELISNLSEVRKLPVYENIANQLSPKRKELCQLFLPVKTVQNYHTPFL